MNTILNLCFLNSQVVHTTTQLHNYTQLHTTYVDVKRARQSDNVKEVIECQI